MKTHCLSKVKAVVVWVLVSIVPLNATPGPDDIDSLRRLTAAQPGSREKADNLYSLARTFYLMGEMDSAMAYAEKTLALSLRFQYGEGIADAHYLQSVIYDKTSDYNAAMASARELLQVVKSLNDSTRLGKGYYQYGQLLEQIGESDSAAHYLHKCLAICMARRDTSRIISTCNALGNMHQNMSAFDSAAHYYMRTINLAEASGNLQYLAKLYNNLGKTFYRMEEFDDARKYLEMALEHNENNNDDYTTALILINLGNNYLHLRQPEQALMYYDRAAKILEPFGDIIDITDLYNNYAEAYQLLGKHDLALDKLLKALPYYTRLNYPEGMSVALCNIGEIYTHQGKYDLAQVTLDSGLNVATRAGYLKNQLDILTAMIHNYQKAGDYRKVDEYQTKRYDLSREIFDVNKDIVVKDLELKYDKEKNLAEILTLRNENLNMELDLRKRTNQRNGYLYTGLAVLLFALFISIYLRQRVTIGKQKIRQLEEEKKLMAARLLVEGQEQERKRIARELHDGLGVLLSATKIQFTNIKDKSPENQLMIEKATQMLEQATGDVRKISHNMMPGLLTKLGLFEAVEDLFDNINDGEDIHAVCQITGEQIRIPENKEIMVYRIIQEMVNNSLKHSGAENIEMNMKIFPGQLHFKFTDDGKGFDVKKVMASETGSFGLKSIESRVGFLNGEIDMWSEPGKGVRYTLQVPL